MIRFWHEKYANRHEWAYKEYERFIRRLDATVVNKFELSDQISVVLYGRTQSGKTTVLLNLLGIKEEFEDSVSNTLRAGRDKGRSSTPAATIYTKNNSDQWSLNGKNLSKEALENQLKEIRSEVEGGTFNVEKESYLKREIHIGIPASYFHATDFDNAGFQIIDLPGTCCENDNERKIATEIAEIYVPRADIVLIVTLANDLGHLTKNNMVAVDQLQTWYLLPTKFRILLTHTFSQSSIQDLYRHDVSEIREYIKGQLKTFLKDDYPCSRDNFFYPLECGDSWKSLKTNEENFEIFSPLREAFFAELRKDVLASATKWGRLRMVNNIGSIAEERKKRRMEEDENKKKDIADKIERKKSHKIKSEKWLKFLQGKADNLEKMLKDYTSYTITEPELQFFPETERKKQNPITDDVTKHLTDARKLLLDKYTDFVETTYKIVDIKRIDPFFSPRLRREMLDNIDPDSLGGRFLWWRKKAYSTHRGLVKDCQIVYDAFVHDCQILMDDIRQEKDQVCQKISNCKRKADRAAKRCSDVLKIMAYDKKIEILQKECDDIENSQKKFFSEMDNSIKLAGDFDRSLDDACRRHIAEEKETLKQMKNPVHQFLQLCYLTIPDKIRKEISKNE